MEARKSFVRAGLALWVVAAAGLMTAVPAIAQMQQPAKAGEDDAVEFAKLDKNKDGFIDKGEAVMEPKLLAKWVDADANKDGKISKEEFLAFERKEHPAKKQ